LRQVAPQYRQIGMTHQPLQTENIHPIAQARNSETSPEAVQRWSVYAGAPGSAPNDAPQADIG
jgi:hypothetical protein